MFKIHSSTKFSRIFATLALLWALCVGTNFICLAANQVPFNASYHNQITADFSGFPIVTVTSVGTALVTHLGNVTTRAISETVDLSTGEAVAVHEFTAANGDTIQISFHFLLISTGPASFDID